MADGQPAKTIYAYDGLAGLHTITMVYNELRQPIGKDYTNSVNNNHNFKWRETIDNLGRVATTSTIHNSITTQTGKNYFDPIGNLVMMGVGSTGVSTDPHIDYQVIKKDIRDQLTSQMSKFFRVGLTYNAAGNITNQYWSNEYFDNATASSSNINQYTYTYDKMNRLIGADYKQSTLTSNPFAYFNAVSGTLPSDFSCYVNEGDVINLLHPFYAEWEENISRGENADQSKQCLDVINELQANYISNNVPYAVMNQTEKGEFLTAFFTTCIEKKYEIMAFEVYQATKVDDQAHIDSLIKDGVTARTMKYVDLLLIDMPFVTNQDCFPNPNATAYGYLPDFVTPTATTNSTKYDAAYWYTENGNITQLNRNDGDVTPVKTIQAYSYSNTLNNRLTNVIWTVGGVYSDQCNYSYDVTGNLLTDSKNNVSSINYSLFNDMPSTIVNTGGAHSYRYFGGQRTVKEISDVDREYYIGGIVLNQTGNVKSYQTSNGYVTPNSTTNGVDHFYNVKDCLGTNRAVLSSNGTVINASDNYPYGKKLPERNEFTSSYEGYRYQFTGHELDGETGYQYHGARFYNEELGKYMSADPIPKYHESVYAYAANNPICYMDPTGEDSVQIGGKWYWEITHGDHYGTISKSTGVSIENLTEWNSQDPLELESGTILNLQNNGNVHFVYEKTTPNIYNLTVAGLLLHPTWFFLNYNGPITNHNKNRSQVCPPGTCTYKPGYECDEFPYASTQQGGAGAVSDCVPKREQRIQGGQLSGVYRKMQAGDQFLVVPVPSMGDKVPVRVPVGSPASKPVFSPIKPIPIMVPIRVPQKPTYRPPVPAPIPIFTLPTIVPPIFPYFWRQMLDLPPERIAI